MLKWGGVLMNAHLNANSRRWNVNEPKIIEWQRRMILVNYKSKDLPLKKEFILVLWQLFDSFVCFTTMAQLLLLPSDRVLQFGLELIRHNWPALCSKCKHWRCALNSKEMDRQKVNMFANEKHSLFGACPITHITSPSVNYHRLWVESPPHSLDGEADQPRTRMNMGGI